LIMPSLFSSVAARSRSISTCVKGGVHIVNIDFELIKLALVTFVSSTACKE